MEEFISDNPSSIMGNTTPASVKKQLWEKWYLTCFKFGGQYYYIDKRLKSPFSFEYDIWEDNGKDKLHHRVTDNEMCIKLCNYINRKKKIKKILGKII